MQGQTESTVQDEGADRRLKVRPLRVHNNHIQAGRREVASCVVCKKGLASLMEEIAATRARDSKDEVPAGGGTDKEGDAPSPPGDWVAAFGDEG